MILASISLSEVSTLFLLGGLIARIYLITLKSTLAIVYAKFNSISKRTTNEWVFKNNSVH